MKAEGTLFGELEQQVESIRYICRGKLTPLIISRGLL